MNHFVCILCAAIVVVVAGMPTNAVAVEGSRDFGVDSRWLRDAPELEYAHMMQILNELVFILCPGIAAGPLKRS